MDKYKVGQRIKFTGEKSPYKIRAVSENFLICTIPYNFKKTFIYIIVDFQRNIRGADNYRCKFDYRKEEDLTQALKELENGILQVSHRNFLPLDIESVY